MKHATSTDYSNSIDKELISTRLSFQLLKTAHNYVFGKNLHKCNLDFCNRPGFL